jgi:uncharacterized protein YcaQ
LARAGLLKPEWTGMPRRASGRGRRARQAALAVVRRFGYLQLDTVSVAGARSHAIVLHSRLQGFDASLGEELLAPGEPLFEYWGHEASWLPLELYPLFEFRRQEFRHHPWWGDLIGDHPQVAEELLRRIENEGPLRSADFEGRGSRGWWDLKVAKKVASALWSRGDLAIRERKGFLRSFDLAERVIPEELRRRPLGEEESLERLLEKALEGHGWAPTGTLAATWRLKNRASDLSAALRRLTDQGRILPCHLEGEGGGKPTPGWIRPSDLELAQRLDTVRPRRDRGVLLSPFDPLLWDRPRVRRLFGFDQVLEIYKPVEQRLYGYYCLPVLAGEKLVARVDLKAERKEGRLTVLSLHFEPRRRDSERAAQKEATRSALEDYAAAVGLELDFAGYRL